MVIAALASRQAQACDPNESCNRCLVSAFGHCVTSGNDPICEARKKACQISPGATSLPGSPFGTGEPLAPGGPLGMSSADCISDIARCPSQVIARLGYQVIAPFANSYIQSMENQADGRWQGLPPDFIGQVQVFYPVNLSGVRYATNINTVHGNAITIGNEIFFPGDLDLSDDDDAHTMYHELQHVVQYARRGGVQAFLTEYVLKSGGQVISQGSINVHDSIDLEQEAIAKSDEVAARVASMSSSTPDVSVQDSPISNRCFSNAGICQMPFPAPFGTACHCGPNGGQIQ